MDKEYRFQLPSTIHTGPGSSAQAGTEARRLGAAKVLVVTHPGIVAAGHVETVSHALEGADLPHAVFDGLQPEPLDTNVHDGLEMCRAEGCDLVMAVGGGSSIDVAKSIAMLMTNPGRIADYMGLENVKEPPLPLMALPTTAGTGSEVTRFDIITDTRGPEHVKMLIGSALLIPRVAIVDPTFALTMPQDLTAAVGVDALTHAIEAFVCVKAQPVTDTLAQSAISLIAGNLRQAWADPTNLKARALTMQGAMEAGMAFSNSAVGLVHGMSRPIGAKFHTPHGISNAVLLPTVCQFSLVGAPERYARVAQLMGEDIEDLSPMEAARLAVVALSDLNREINVPTLSQLGFSREEFMARAPVMAEEALASGSPNNNPRKATKEEIVELYEECFDTEW